MTADGGCGWKMWKEKTADSQKSKKNKTRNSDDKINKETKKKGKKAFYQARAFKSKSYGWALKSTVRVVNSWHSLLKFFLNSLNAVISFINVTETRTTHSSSLKVHMLWCTSALST